MPSKFVVAYSDNGYSNYGTAIVGGVDAPTVQTDAASSVTASGATLNGRITATGGENVDTRGFHYHRMGSSTWTDWTLVQNPNTSPVTVEVSYLKAGGGAVTLTKSIPANSRMTFNMADKVPSGRASIMVTSKTAGKKIMVERAMHGNNKGAGTDTIGGFSD